MENNPMPMFETKDKLRTLEKFFPNTTSPVTFEFGRFLAEYLHTSLRPQEFVEEYRMAIADLILGRNGFTDKQINGRIGTYPRGVYEMLSCELGRIAVAVLPKEFASASREFMSERERMGT